MIILTLAALPMSTADRHDFVAQYELVIAQTNEGVRNQRFLHPNRQIQNVIEEIHQLVRNEFISAEQAESLIDKLIVVK